MVTTALTRECTYGLVKRYRFVEATLAECQPECVLDVGCGTGKNLTVPLAGRFPATRFVGADPDAGSIEFARRENRRENLEFRLTSELRPDEQFDVVIASEVVEHVEEPREFLDFLRERLKPGGRLVLTLPNGYGPFEIGAFVQNVLHLTGLLDLLRRVKSLIVGRRRDGGVTGTRGRGDKETGEQGEKAAIAVPSPCPLVPLSSSVTPAGRPQLSEGHDTLAISPHLNFFSFGMIRRLIDGAGLKIERYQPRTFLCGFGFDQSLPRRLAGFNAMIADRLPARLNSGWMFVLSRSEARGEYTYRRGPYARLRRYLNEKQFGLRPRKR